MSGHLTARTLLTLMKKKYEIRTTEGSRVTEILLLPNKFNEDQLKLYIYIWHTNTPISFSKKGYM